MAKRPWWKLSPTEQREAAAACNALLCAVADPRTPASQVVLLKNALGQIVGRRVYLRVYRDPDDSSVILGAADYPTR